jgi:hypothetical protein
MIVIRKNYWTAGNADKALALEHYSHEITCLSKKVNPAGGAQNDAHGQPKKRKFHADVTREHQQAFPPRAYENCK